VTRCRENWRRKQRRSRKNAAGRLRARLRQLGNTPIRVQLCCNSHRNGMFRGRLSDIVFGDCELISLYLPNVRIRYLDDGKRIAIAGKKWRVFGHREWVGNWCWNMVTMRLADAVSLLNHLRSVKGAGCEVAEESLYATWGAGKVFTVEDLAEAAR
jgi:hypothetical protein